MWRFFEVPKFIVETDYLIAVWERERDSKIRRKGKEEGIKITEEKKRNIVADGWAGASNPHPHIHNHTQKVTKILVFSTFLLNQHG